MKSFMDDNFLLNTETAKTLYHNYAKNMPIFDFHNHLSAQEIYENTQYDNITQAWLGGDHYKWRAMRTYGFPESMITGKESTDYDKFKAWAETIENAIGNPLYHWTHLELQRYFGVTKPLSTASCEEIWNTCNEKLKSEQFTVRNLLKMQNVKALCTTNDPIEDLEYHKKLQEEGFEIKVLPTFRPDKAVLIGKEGYESYIASLEQASGITITSLPQLKKALEKRLEFFISIGCVITDHSLEGMIFEPCTDEEANEIFCKRMKGESLSFEERRKFQGNLLVSLGKLYKSKNMAMQLHIGALRNNSTRMFQKLGADTGFDCIDDFIYAPELSALLNEMDKTDELPKTILYCLNQRDYEILACMCGNFQSSPYKGKVQFGTAWWFCDNKRGMEEQMDVLATLGLLSVFIGMLTDSRSFLSFPRHEYFRRILCNLIGTWVENGEYPSDMEYLAKLVENISYNNSVNYLGLNE